MGNIGTEAFRKALLEDLKQYQKNMGLYIGQEIATALTEEAHDAIRNFYTSYHPNYYERNYNFWRSYRKVHTNINGTRTVGVELLPDSIPNVYTGRSSSPMEVFGRVYYLGWHGIASGQINENGELKAPIMSPSPYKRIASKRDEIIENPYPYINKAREKAKKRDKYQVLKLD